MFIQFFISILVVCFASLSADNVPIVNGKCNCYKVTSGNCPANELKDNWNKLKNDIILKIPLTRTEPEDLHEYRAEYDDIYYAAKAIYKNQTSLVTNLKTETPAYYYPSDFERLFDGLYRLDFSLEEWELFDRIYTFDRKLCASRFTSRCHTGNHEETIAMIKDRAKNRRQIWERKRKEIWSLFERIHDLCKKKHISLLALYENGFFQLKKGNFYSAMQNVKKLIELAEELNNKEYLTNDTYLTMGLVSSLSHEYTEALAALSEAISKNPSNTDAYIERAIVYFEIGDFEQAIKEYLTANIDEKLTLPLEESKLDFAKGFLKGAHQGIHQRSVELPASIASSVRGISQALWSTILHPIEMPKQFIQDAIDSFQHLQSLDSRALSKELTPELHALLQKWHSLASEIQGEQLGVLVGKYGIDILTVAVTSKGIQHAINLRRSNALCNLKSLSILSQSTGGQGPFIQAVHELMADRQKFFSSAKIHADKQGKHIKGHKNFIDEDFPSILTYPDPDYLLKKYAGKGKAYGTVKPGKSGYKEVVVCDEVIGECVDELGKTIGTTNRATIHYDKNGKAHIVPANPNPNL